MTDVKELLGFSDEKWAEIEKYALAKLGRWQSEGCESVAAKDQRPETSGELLAPRVAEPGGLSATDAHKDNDAALQRSGSVIGSQVSSPAPSFEARLSSLGPNPLPTPQTETSTRPPDPAGSATTVGTKFVHPSKTTGIGPAALVHSSKASTSTTKASITLRKEDLVNPPASMSDASKRPLSGLTRRNDSAASNNAMLPSMAESREVYIDKLGPATTKAHLKQFFKGYNVETIFIWTNPWTGCPAGNAFVIVSSPSEAEHAVSKLNGKTVQGREVSVRHSRPQLAQSDSQPANVRVGTSELRQYTWNPARGEHQAADRMATSETVCKQTEHTFKADFIPPRAPKQQGLVNRQTSTKPIYHHSVGINAQADKASAVEPGQNLKRKAEYEAESIPAKKCSGRSETIIQEGRPGHDSAKQNGVSNQINALVKMIQPSLQHSVHKPLISFAQTTRTRSSLLNKPQTNAIPPDEEIPGRVPPKWYCDLKVDNTRGRDDGPADMLLRALKTQILKAHIVSGPGLEACFQQTRVLLHRVAFQPVSSKVLRNNRMLHAEGLPRIFDKQSKTNVAWPFDVRADAEELYNKWCEKVFETDLLRGIVPGKLRKAGEANNHTADSLDREWTAQHPYTLDTGSNNLLNGQWWPTLLAALRDGAHGATQAGIYYRATEGAISCVISGDRNYENVDNGDVILYNGVDADVLGVVSRYTQAMIDRVGSGRPIRLLRAHSLRSPWAPKAGFRYDGLYDVVEIETRPPPSDPRQRFRFKLVRRPSQDPIRGGDSPAARPTPEELEAWAKDKKNRGFQ